MKRLLCLLLAVFFLFSVSLSEEYYETVWILCQPDSFVNIRFKPSGRSDVIGYADCGDAFETDGRIKNGFLHVYATIENGEGWISCGYVVYSKPEYIGKKMVVDAKGRVKARKTVNGKRRCWVKPGDVVKVYWAAEWAATNKGFIKYEYLEAIE